MTYVTACIDGSASAPAVCDYAAWASQRLDAPLTFLHVLDQRQYPMSANLSGNIGLGSREHLLDELAALDEQRNKLALEQGLVMLAAAKERAIA
ncbi:universal stress protein, partial [Pseudomonas aeruginosa]